ncbi:MAG: dTDP-4-dehydrorhamnose 3,5-epimerase [Gammaproteobacteria bacterium]|nr:dTDP-4-dehydrorhamnose 3,5-epimerase [Gammaproteobacteria bacterium]
MIIHGAQIPGIKIIEPKLFKDKRGYFIETYSENRYQEALNIQERFVQDNLSYSKQGTLRGLHYQLKRPQGKLVSVILGEVFDVAVDIRQNSPTFRQWVSIILTNRNHRQFYIPPGFAHGFYVLSREAIFVYKCTDYYVAEDNYGIIWNDATINVKWPLNKKKPILSDKDQNLRTLVDVSLTDLPTIL